MRKNSLIAQLGLLLTVSVLAGALLYGALRFGGGAILGAYFDRSEVQTQVSQRHIASLQRYVTKYDLSTEDHDALTEWAKKNPTVLLEVYSGSVMKYSSVAPDELPEGSEEVTSPYYDWLAHYEVQFSNGAADVAIYTADKLQWQSYLSIAAILLGTLLGTLIFLYGCKSIVRYIILLSEEIQAMEGGDLNTAVTVAGSNELTQLARSLDAMRIAVREQRQQENALYLTHQTLVTNMSHDLRTPLTALQIYIDILRYKKHEPEELDSYLERMDEKAQQIKSMADRIFEYSLIAKPLPVPLDAPTPFRRVFHDLLSDYVADWGKQGLRLHLSLDWPDVSIAIHPPFIRRILDNISSNLLKYAERNALIFIEVHPQRQGAAVSFVNTIRRNAGKQESNRIGLSSVIMMMEKMNGTCTIEQTATTFRIALWFPLAK